MMVDPAVDVLGTDFISPLAFRRRHLVFRDHLADNRESLAATTFPWVSYDSYREGSKMGR